MGNIEAEGRWRVERGVVWCHGDGKRSLMGCAELELRRQVGVGPIRRLGEHKLLSPPKLEMDILT